MSRAPVGGNTPSELEIAARRAVVECLRVTPGEALIVVHDRTLVDLASAMEAAGSDAGARAERIEIGSEAGELERVSHALERCDTSALVATYGADIAVRRAMVQVRGRRRHAHMIGLTDAVIRQALAVDPRETASLGQRLIERMRPSSRFEVKSPGGTSLVVETDPDHRWHNEHGILDGPGWTNLPAGEVITSPARVDGVFVPDGGVWMTDGSALDRTAIHRLRLRFAWGRLVDVDGPDEAAHMLLSHLTSGRDGRRVGQVSFGTNAGVVAPIGVSAQDVKLRGFHLILGYSAPELTGASWNGDRIVQLLQRRAAVWVDGVPVLANGRYVFGE